MKRTSLTYPEPWPQVSIVETAPLASEDGPSTITEEQRGAIRTWRALLWSAGLVTAALQSWAFRHVVSSDGIAYLDIARYCARGHWAALINGYWSPLYPFLLGLALRAFNPSPYWESTIAHLVNVVIFVFAFVCFELLLRALIENQQVADIKADDREALPAWALFLLGDAIFVYSTLMFLHMELVHPDLCVAALVFLGSSLILRIRTGQAGWPTYVIFGAVLGLAYLAKQVMFPLAFVFLGCAVFGAKLSRRSVSHAALALLAFACVAGPFVFSLSRAEGRFTVGDTGKIAYAEMVNGATRFVHWQGGPPETGTALHPTRQLLIAPPVFEFAKPVEGTYPPWYSPAYWYAGISPTFRPRNQLRAIRYTIEEYAGIFPFIGGIFAGFVALALFARENGSVWHGLASQWPLWVPAVAALSLYALVYVESRLVAPFLVLAWLGLFSGLKFPRNRISSILTKYVVLGMVGMMGAGIIWLAGRSFFRALAPEPFVDWEVAQSLRELGVQPGDEVASIGWGIYGYWAHLVDVRIVAEVPPSGAASYWTASPEIHSKVLNDFAKAGAKVVVTDEKPPEADSSWVELGDTDHFALKLNALSQSANRIPPE